MKLEKGPCPCWSLVFCSSKLMFLNAMYGGLGQSLGALIGGKLQSKIGTVRTFLYSAIFDFCFVAVIIAYCILRRHSNFKDPLPITTWWKITIWGFMYFNAVMIACGIQCMRFLWCPCSNNPRILRFLLARVFVVLLSGHQQWLRT